MIKLLFFLIFVSTLLSCSRENDQVEDSNPSSLGNSITGTYKGGTLSWSKTTSNLVHTEGTDTNVQFKIENNQ